MKKLSLLFLFLLFGILPFSAFAQEKMKADSLYYVARQYSIDGKYDESIQLSEKILEQYPAYYDVRILMARTYAWQNDYESAVKNISQVIEEDPRNYDAYNALVDFYFWSGDNRASLATVDRALEYYPEDANLLTKKAKVQLADDNVSDARHTIDQLEELDPENESLSILKKGAGLLYSNIVRLEHYYDTFNKPYERNWHMSSVGYGRRTSFGDYYAKVYVGDMIQDGESLYSDGVGKQFALECYPKIDDYNSMYVNYAWSPDAIFPQHRAGLEYYHVFRNRIELSAGYRFMNYSKDLPENVNVHIITGSLAKYMGKFWLSFRPYFVFSESESSDVFLLTGRYYLPKDESYLGLMLGTGVSPDNPYFYTSGEAIPDLQSWRVEMEWKQKLSSFLLFELQGGYENAEYTVGERRNQLSLRTSISILF
ncbi:YaiO family outer membrane beta-barrel protein [Mangrovibacterium lignilyticum]|uniref:YaiO family outer membrane beta-barrel protein n=1 Tax=Mangrovibacterium lignilyticum TaxID=2668052 RepID=UPI0013D0BA21|nr:YaiO family outer membrane beta-barrel protein [Mangrovibacterium lignilyticum]